MGTWGVGNLDDDSARDYLADMVAVWERIIGHALAGELEAAAVYFGPEASFHFEPGLETIEACVMPTIEVLITVAENLGCDYLPDDETVTAWEQNVLATWDEQSPLFEWTPEDQRARRSVLENTFARLRKVTAGRHGDEAEP